MSSRRSNWFAPALLWAGVCCAQEAPAPAKPAKAAPAKPAKAAPGKPAPAKSATEKPAPPPVESSAKGNRLVWEMTQIILDQKYPEDWPKIIDLGHQAGTEPLSESDRSTRNRLLEKALILRGQVYAQAAIDADFAGDAEGCDRARLAALVDLEEAQDLREHGNGLLQIADLHLLPGGDRARGIEAAEKAVQYFAARKLPVDCARAHFRLARFAKDEAARLKHFDDAVKAAPKLASAWRFRAEARFAAGMFDEALADLLMVVKVDPKDPISLKMCRDVLVETGRYDEAVALLEKTMKVLPAEAWSIRGIRARIWILQRKSDKALQEIENLIAERPFEPYPYELRLKVLADLGRYDVALADVRRLREVGGPYASARVAAVEADLLVRLERPDEAVKVMRDYLGDHPKDLDGRSELALLLYRVKQDEAAEKVLRRLADTPSLLRMRAGVYLKLGKHREAIADCRKLLERDPDDLFALKFLAWLMATSPDDSLRDGAAALEFSRKANERTAYKDRFLLANLAACHAETGDFKGALEWIAKAEALSYEIMYKNRFAAHRKQYEANKPWREAVLDAVERE